jgi:outer membrane protein TolC
MAQAQQDGNLTSDALTAALTAYTDTNRQYTDLQRTALQTHRDLNSLLGLESDVRLQLADSDDIAPLPDSAIDAALQVLSQRRPDLLALEAGYQAQEQKYRAAILGQFPGLSVGFVRASDTTPIYTSGFQINLNLPIFNRNQGNVAIERATRQRLRDEYQERLNAAYADVAQIRADTALLARQLSATESSLPEVDRVAKDASDAYAERDLALGSYVDAQTVSLTKRVDAATLRESLAEQRVGLQALLGSAIPDAYSTDQKFTESHAK